MRYFASKRKDDKLDLHVTSDDFLERLVTIFGRIKFNIKEGLKPLKLPDLDVECFELEEHHKPAAAMVVGRYAPEVLRESNVIKVEFGFEKHSSRGFKEKRGELIHVDFKRKELILEKEENYKSKEKCKNTTLVS